MALPTPAGAFGLVGCELCIYGGLEGPAGPFTYLSIKFESANLYCLVAICINTIAGSLRNTSIGTLTPHTKLSEPLRPPPISLSFPYPSIWLYREPLFNFSEWTIPSLIL